MAVKLEGLSPKELESLINQAQSRMESARTEQVQAVRIKIDALLRASGLQLADVFPGRGGKGGKQRAKRAGAGIPKFRNPANPEQTWTGFGKKPAWFVDALKKRGVTAESLQIGGTATKKAPARAVKKTARKGAAKKSGRKATAKKSAKKSA
jgi:DNA-binding protein H-NS